MTAPGDTRLQANFKLPNGDLINVYGSDAFDFKGNLEALSDLAQQVTEVGNVLRGVGVAVDAGLTGVPAPQYAQPAPAPQPAQYAPPAQAPAPQQQWQPQPSASPARAAGPAPVCQHGPMIHRSGTKNDKRWSAHFCPAAKNDPSQCDPVWS